MEKIIFVYNADTALAAVIADFVTKLITPKSYACNLCMVTYGAFTMKPEWKKFLRELPLTVNFLHRNEFRERYHKDTPLPAAFSLVEGKPVLLISAEEMNRLSSVEELKTLVLARTDGAAA